MSQAGKTSSEVVIKDGKIVRAKAWAGFNFWHSLLAISAVMITFATVLLYVELSKWGTITDLPWKTTQAKTQFTAEE